MSDFKWMEEVIPESTQAPINQEKEKVLIAKKVIKPSFFYKLKRTITWGLPMAIRFKKSSYLKMIWKN